MSAPATPTPSGPPRMSEGALIVTDLAIRLEEDERRLLARLLARSLSAPEPARLRENVLGLLAEMVRHGEYVTVERYEAERATRHLLGQEWPAATTLLRRYGRKTDCPRERWRKAVHAAARLAFRGGLGHVPASYRHGGHKRKYLRADVTLAIREFYWLHHVWPTQWEYEEWARLRRLRDGQGTRLPGLQQIRTLFGSWSRAVEVAETEQDQELDAFRD
jgi:hypothetical protein